jgi:sigma-B regulation protein RsbU (phosphoserine phosphatase)
MRIGNIEMIETLSLETLSDRDVVLSAPKASSQPMHCMEVWGGRQLTARGVEFGGLETWVYSKPYGDSRDGGDVYYASSCATGRIARFLLADVAGHGDAVAETANGFESLMRRFVNRVDQGEFVRLLNQHFAEVSPSGVFATAIVATFFAPSRRLGLCNAGHPRPLLYRAASREWSLLAVSDERACLSSSNMPLGIFQEAEYRHFDIELERGDCVVAYTDALMEAAGPDGEILGENGLLELARSLKQTTPRDLAEALLGELNCRCPDALTCDDVTVMVMRANDRPLRFSLAQKLDAIKRFAKSFFASLGGDSEKPPFPDWNLANLGGAIIPALARRWRPPQNSSRA